jgi:hypothetical protein
MKPQQHVIKIARCMMNSRLSQLPIECVYMKNAINPPQTPSLPEPKNYRTTERPSICAFGTACSTLSHSPLKALINHHLSSAIAVSTPHPPYMNGQFQLTIVYNLIRIVEIDAVIRVWKHMHIIILDARKVKLVEQGERVLHVHVVVCYTVHDEESHVFGERVDV